MVAKAQASEEQAEVVDLPASSPPATNGTDHELTAEDILSADDSLIQRVEVPEWGGHVFVRGMTGAERDAFEKSIIERRGKNREVNLDNLRAKLVVATAQSSQGKPVFTGAHVAALGQKSALALHRVFKVAQDLSGLGDDDVEELTKELGKDPNDDSGSD